MRRGAGLSDRHPAACEENFAGGVADCDLSELRPQHDVCDRVADGVGDPARHARCICAASPKMAKRRHDAMHDGCIGRAGMGNFALLALEGRNRSDGLSIVQRAKRPDIRRDAAGILAKILALFSEAPILGHGTGSIRGLFEEAAVDQSGAAAQVIGNPHNQTLNVAIQWGVIGIVVLYAMWLSHLLLFRREGLVAWIGLLVVVQNIFTSLFNSHLFDFHEGWMYMLGVGVAGGLLKQQRRHCLSVETLDQRK